MATKPKHNFKMAFTGMLWKACANRFISPLLSLEQVILSRLRLVVATPLNLSLAGEEDCLHDESDGFLLMAVPKKKTTPSKKKLRNRHKWLKNRTDIETCAVCGDLKLMNHLCGHCLERVKEQTSAYRREHKQDEVFWPIPDILRKFRT